MKAFEYMGVRFGSYCLEKSEGECTYNCLGVKCGPYSSENLCLEERLYLALGGSLQT